MQPEGSGRVGQDNRGDRSGHDALPPNARQATTTMKVKRNFDSFWGNLTGRLHAFDKLITAVACVRRMSRVSSS